MHKILFLLALSPLTSLASASSELVGGSTAYVNARTDSYENGSDQSSATTLYLNFTYGYFLSPYWEAQASVFAQDTTGTGAYSIIPKAGMAYNLSDETQNSFYLGARLGPAFVTPSSGHHYVVLSFDMFLGKRFALTEHVSWAPEVSYNGHTGGTTSVDGSTWYYYARRNWTFTPFQVAVLF